jgi:predicted nuclease of predicted toxin-antitoxin system
MRVLFDKGVPVRLRHSLSAHSVTTAYELGWDALENGELLKTAQDQFDVLITTDSNMKYQQRLTDYDIALIVLRAFNTKLGSYLPLIPEIETTLTTIQSGEVVYIYADQKLALKDQRKGRKRGKPGDSV